MNRSIVITPLSIRDYDNGFFDALAGLRRVEMSKEKFHDIMMDRQRQGVRTFVAIGEGERVLGTASIIIESKFWGNCGYIQDVSVHPDFQGDGIGTMLLNHLLLVADRERCYKCILECTDELVPYYEDRGFHKQYNAMRYDYQRGST